MEKPPTTGLAKDDTSDDKGRSRHRQVDRPRGVQVQAMDTVNDIADDHVTSTRAQPSNNFEPRLWDTKFGGIQSFSKWD